MLDKKTFTLTALSIVVPAASKMTERFLMISCYIPGQRDRALNLNGQRITYSVGFHITFLNLHGIAVKCNHARAEHQAICDNGLVVDAGEGFWCLCCVDWGFGGHGACGVISW